MLKSELLRFLSAYPLAIWQEWLKALPEKLANAEMDAAAERDAAVRAVSRQNGAVAVVPVRGVIMPKRNIWEILGLATSTETIERMVSEAVADREVKAVVLDVDSPGGITSGVPELAATLRGLRGKKPIVAHADHLAASAAYWIAASTDEIVATPSALVGSVGVYLMHVDYSAALEAEGIKVTFVHAGEDKVLGNVYEPLSDDGRAYLQGLVDDAYRMFVGDVAKGRNTTVAEVEKNYGQGRVLTASDALSAGVIDKVRTLAETLTAYGVTQNRGRIAAARERRAIDALANPEVFRV